MEYVSEIMNMIDICLMILVFHPKGGGRKIKKDRKLNIIIAIISES